MTSYVSLDLCRLVAARAYRLCEYCLIHEDDTYFGCSHGFKNPCHPAICSPDSAE